LPPRNAKTTWVITYAVFFYAIFKFFRGQSQKTDLSSEALSEGGKLAILFPACHPYPGLFSKKARITKPSKGFKLECYKEFLEMVSQVLGSVASG
jgi:hypothetical protein